MIQGVQPSDINSWLYKTVTSVDAATRTADTDTDRRANVIKHVLVTQHSNAVALGGMTCIASVCVRSRDSAE